MPSDHPTLIGQRFLEESWRVSCACGWSIDGLTSHADAIAAANSHATSEVKNDG
jgi:hypothetical protein